MEFSNINTQQSIEHRVIDDVQKFLDHALSGAVYVKIGHNLPRDIQYELVETFRNISQQIIWEHDEILYNLPDNVMICNSLLSKNVLSHKNTALFVTEDDTIVIKQALHYGIPMLIVPFRNSELHSIVKYTALENMSSIRVDEIKKEFLVQKFNKMLQNKDLKAHAKEIANLLHHNSVNLSSDFLPSKESAKYQSHKSREISQSHLHLDALGALFFVIFVIVKVSLKFCRFYNSWEWKTNTATKKTT